MSRKLPSPPAQEFTAKAIVLGVFFLAVPRMYAYNWSFQLKMALVLLAGINFLIYYLKVEPELVRNGPNAAPTALARAAENGKQVTVINNNR